VISELWGSHVGLGFDCRECQKHKRSACYYCAECSVSYQGYGPFSYKLCGACRKAHETFHGLLDLGGK
jgi:hypothetical protein